MDLKNLPVNTCPLCRQAALDQSTDQWTCDFCGGKLDFDPTSRRTRITYWPAQYAALKAGVGSGWLSRREMFERIDAAAAAAPPERAPRMIGPLLIIAAALLLLCVMLGAVASAIVISPSIARTRRTISQAYLPTATATMTSTAMASTAATAVMTMTTPAIEQPAVTSPLSITQTPAAPESGVTTPTPLPTPALPTPAPQQVTQPQPQPLPTQPPALPPTFTPVPTLAALPTQPLALPGAQTSPLPPGSPTQVPPLPATLAPGTAATITPLPSTPTPTATVTPTVASQPTVTNTQPLQPGSQLLVGTVRVFTVMANGTTALNEADEYVELRNEGQTPAYLDGWKLRAIRNADNVQLDEYTFPGGSVIAANQTCRIYTNLPFGPENCGFAGGFANDQPIWLPNGARAVLVNPQGQEMSRFVY